MVHLEKKLTSVSDNMQLKCFYVEAFSWYQNKLQT